MKNLFKVLMLFAMVSLAAACSQDCTEEAVDMDAVTQEITAMEAAFQEAENAGDVEGVLAYYADDAHSMAPDQPTLKGKDAIRADWMEDEDEDGEGSIAFEVRDIWAAGNIAVETGSWIYTTPEGEYTGKYMSLFEKRDGKYVCIRDIWNSDMDYDDDNGDDMDEENGEEANELMEEDASQEM